jgi:hypothetical protein
MEWLGILWWVWVFVIPELFLTAVWILVVLTIAGVTAVVERVPGRGGDKEAWPYRCAVASAPLRDLLDRTVVVTPHQLLERLFGVLLSGVALASVGGDDLPVRGDHPERPEAIVSLDLSRGRAPAVIRANWRQCW